jgi:hypothetical protein
LILLIALLLAALVTTIVVVGSRLLNPTPQVHEIPRGGAAVLVFASIVGESGDIFTVRADGTDARS